MYRLHRIVDGDTTQRSLHTHSLTCVYINTKQNAGTSQSVRNITMDDTRTNHGFHRLPVRPNNRKRGVEVKKLPECIIDEPMIKPVVKATDLRALLGHDEPPAKRFKQGNYKVDCKETPRTVSFIFYFNKCYSVLIVTF